MKVDRKAEFSSVEYKGWRLAVLNRDNGFCRECYDYGRGVNRTLLEVHHIFPVSTHPHLRFDVQNGVTLCKECHSKTKYKESQFANYYLELIGSEIKDYPRNSLKNYFETYGNLIKRLYLESNATNTEIAQYIGCCKDTVAIVIKQLGLPNRRVAMTRHRQLYEQNPKLCKSCDAPFGYKKRRKTYCSNKCQMADPEQIENFCKREFSNEVRKNISEKIKKLWEDSEYRENALKAQKASWTDEKREAQAARAKLQMTTRYKNEEFLERQRESLTKIRLESRDKKSESIKNSWNDPVIRAKRIAGLVGIKHEKIKCPHCGFEGGKTSMRRWHFDNCKLQSESTNVEN